MNKDEVSRAFAAASHYLSAASHLILNGETQTAFELVDKARNLSANALEMFRHPPADQGTYASKAIDRIAKQRDKDYGSASFRS